MSELEEIETGARLTLSQKLVLKTLSHFSHGLELAAIKNALPDIK